MEYRNEFWWFWTIIIPHKDVASGKYQQAEFAADLAQVLAGNAELEYQDANEFFNRTYMTDGMKQLIASSLRRAHNINGEPVIQLKTAFGGGKTHTMLALYHIYKDKNVQTHEVVKSVLKSIGIDNIPDANTNTGHRTDTNTDTNSNSSSMNTFDIDTNTNTYRYY